MDNVTSDFNTAPQAERCHIVVYGRRNVGKSSLVNALAGQTVAIVSDVPGTTTDPVRKAIELHPIGPCLLVDTAGYDDDGTVGALRNRRTGQMLELTDLALLVTDCEPQAEDIDWAKALADKQIPCITVLSKADACADTSAVMAAIERNLHATPVAVSAERGTGIDDLRLAITRLAARLNPTPPLTAAVASPGDVALLVMPQDKQAPKGRLIMPQAQTIRDLLDRGCTPVCCTPDTMLRTLDALGRRPDVVITDSQVFDFVRTHIPAECRLTSFSILMAAHKGDIRQMVEGAAAIDRVTPQSRVLIAEACTHAPLSEDIGREKIPALLRARVGDQLWVDIVAGRDFPDDLSPYDLVIHCGACMFSRRYMLSRQAQAARQHVPMTNYGIALAHIKGILQSVRIPGQ